MAGGIGPIANLLGKVNENHELLVSVEGGSPTFDDLTVTDDLTVGGDAGITGLLTVGVGVSAPTVTANTVDVTTVDASNIEATVVDVTATVTATTVNATGAYQANGVPGVTAGPFTSIASITVVDGIVTALTGT